MGIVFKSGAACKPSLHALATFAFNLAVAHDETEILIALDNLDVLAPLKLARRFVKLFSRLEGTVSGRVGLEGGLPLSVAGARQQCVPDSRASSTTRWLDCSRPIVKAAPYTDSTLPASNCSLHHVESNAESHSSVFLVGAPTKFHDLF